jgi:hypothetical protein
MRLSTLAPTQAVAAAPFLPLLRREDGWKIAGRTFDRHP